jgi:hypothetical protein
VRPGVLEREFSVGDKQVTLFGTLRATLKAINDTQTALTDQNTELLSQLNTSLTAATQNITAILLGSSGEEEEADTGLVGKVDEIGRAVSDESSGLPKIRGLLEDGTYGLEAIKAAIADKADGLPAVLDLLNHADHGLAKIKEALTGTGTDTEIPAIGTSEDDPTKPTVFGRIAKVQSTLGAPATYGTSPTMGSGLYAYIAETALRAETIGIANRMALFAPSLRKHGSLIDALIIATLRTQMLGDGRSSWSGEWTAREAAGTTARDQVLILWDESTDTRTVGWAGFTRVTSSDHKWECYQVNAADPITAGDVTERTGQTLAGTLTQMETEARSAPTYLNLREFTLLRYSSTQLVSWQDDPNKVVTAFRVRYGSPWCSELMQRLKAVTSDTLDTTENPAYIRYLRP